MVNLGKRYNLKVGDRLKVVKQADIKQWEGIQDTVIAKSTATLQVIYITESNAILQWHLNKPIYSISKNDLVFEI